MWLGRNWYTIWTKTCYIPKVRKYYVKKGYLYQQAWKCHIWHVNVYFRNHNVMQKGDPMELNFESLEMQKWNIPTDRAQKVDEKNGVIYLVAMFATRVAVIKISHITHFLYFLVMTAKDLSIAQFFAFSDYDSKKKVRVWPKYWMHLKDCIQSF